ncbi:hypothetical protein ElyMa_000766700 [Elysia marginata]|uniref:Uncharacterized protein n=1 Tax=Elysia marginata TaxID=1093978 RepID=A0AAV4GRU3_9GAST|nr:hypothetical protein ElyMa_000766700 [Elysia marginata]
MVGQGATDARGSGNGPESFVRDTRLVKGLQFAMLDPSKRSSSTVKRYTHACPETTCEILHDLRDTLAE